MATVCVETNGTRMLFDDVETAARDLCLRDGKIAVVDRARFERLRLLAEKANGLWAGKGYAIDEFWEQMSRMEPGDRDPLP